MRFEKSGCRPAEVRLAASLSGWTLANLVIANPLAGQGADSPQQAKAQFPVQFAVAGIGILVDACQTPR